ncbi:MAG: radical SAM protein [Acidobacteriota bacterium]|nr:MAG: radical SAM protein [Acidobacteriota bacterium]
MQKKIARTKKRAARRIRETQLFAKALRSPRHPILVHLVPTRRCNLSCRYCNEFDSSSLPVSTGTLFTRIDQLAELGTTMIHLSGGEPMLHPHLESLIERIRSKGMIAGLLTNGILLSQKRIEGLNSAGLDHLQISIDNVEPDDVSKKSLKVLDKKLRLLAEYAEFDVNINSVLGNYLEQPADALKIAERSHELGLSSTVGIIHDEQGQLRPLGAEQRKVYEQIKALQKPLFRAASHNRFQENMVRGLPTDWNCHAGSRYLYICEDGLVHYCSQQRGTPGIPLADYKVDDLDREYRREKDCTRYCTVSCVHRTAWLDTLREDPYEALKQFFPGDEENWTTASLPPVVRGLTWLFLPDQRTRKPSLFSKLALRLLGVR